jgi:AcrR family transcriptional regulator
MAAKSKSGVLPPRERILSAAHELFYRDGIRATGIDRIIAEASVAKVTFYRHFPSKHDLIRAFLEYRHDIWMSWFLDALSRHGGNLNALAPALEEWFRNPGFRGCAFINSVSELGGELLDVAEITRRHKADMATAIAGLLPAGKREFASLIAVVVDGAIVGAQYDPPSRTPLRAVREIVKVAQAGK